MSGERKCIEADLPCEDEVASGIADVATSRRDVLGGLGGSLAALATGVGFVAATSESAAAQQAAKPLPPFAFKELAAGVDERHHVAEGYDADILIRWGDPVLADAPAFDPNKQTAESQKRQFGTNNDFIGYIPLGRNRGVLCVQHEYSEPRMMFPDLAAGKGRGDTTAEQVAVEMAALGGSILEVRRTNGKWSVVRPSRYSRRITTLETRMSIDGPAAGHARLKTKADPTGRTVIGTMGNCAGGITPWGTWLMPEENFQAYFSSDQRDEKGAIKKGIGGEQASSFTRYGIPQGLSAWGRHHERFNVDKEPNEANRFGWIVEVDPLTPGSVPVKHTALGRIRHEGAENALTKDGRIAVYTGDDDRNEFAYKFVSRRRYDADDRRANMRLLSDGTLYVAKFNADGTGQWLPLVHGQGPLTAANGFASQADVLIDTRLAATALGATTMDRPEDMEPGPGGRVIIALTNNSERKPGEENAANPRAPNPYGHVIELLEDAADHAATTFKWSFLVLCGDPRKPEDKAKWHSETTTDGWFACPDNVAFDPAGRLWVGTDQGGNWGKLTGRADGLYAVDHIGDKRGRSRLFFRTPVGAEFTGPRFAPDGETLFLSVQHPSADGTRAYAPFGKDSSAADPATRWPDFKADMPPRPSVVVVTRKGGGKIGV